MAIWNLDSRRETLHGHFSRDLTPVLEIHPRDTIIFQTLDAAWNTGSHVDVDGNLPPKIEREPVLDAGHCLIGPVKIHGAEPGMALEIQIDEIIVGSWGWTVAGFKSAVNDRLGVADNYVSHSWTLDSDALIGTNQHGVSVDLRPFMGVMGMPPDEPGILPTAPPRATGGNLDCKELVAGTSLFLPIAVAGGLFSVGDGHAVQGDGEVCGTAIECPMDRVALTFHVHPNLSLTTPRIKTVNSWMTLGVHEDLQEATLIALNDMLTLMEGLYGFSRSDAVAIASLVVDVRVTQIANGVLGVHAVLPLDAVKMPTG